MDNKIVYLPVNLVDSIAFSLEESQYHDSMVIVPSPTPIITSSGNLHSGESLFGNETFIRKNTFLTFKINNNGSNHFLIGRGYNDYSGNWLEITKDSVLVHRRTTTDVVIARLRHGVSLGSQIKVSINYKESSTANVCIESSGQSYDFNVQWWAGGSMFVSNLSDSDITVSMSLYALDAEESMWIIGDSYINWQDPNRWPYYLFKAGYSDWLGDHLPGAGSKQMLNSFYNDLKLGKPKYAVWCLGMNDKSDTDNHPSSVWPDCVQSFISTCNENNITPILATVPSVPNRNHKAKSAWVRNSNYKYIDISAAVSDNDSFNWYNGYLSTDNVHPTATGAKAIADKILSVFETLKTD